MAEVDFKDLLGYKPDEEKINKRWPPLAPVLYIDGQTTDPYKAFRSQYIKKVSFFKLVILLVNLWIKA
jgi:hypothetical protein